MSKYSALLFKPTTYCEIGPFRFPVYHDLVPGEAKGIEEFSKKQSRSTFKSIKLAQRIAKDKGISTKEAVELLGKVGSEETDLVYEYAAELDDLQVDSIGAVQQRVEFVTLFMQYRGESKLDGEQWVQLKDWEQEDTENMPSKLMDQVFELVMWERDGWPQKDEAKNADDSADQEFSPPRKKS